LLDNPDKKKEVWEDMQRLLARMGRPIPGEVSEARNATTPDIKWFQARLEAAFADDPNTLLKSGRVLVPREVVSFESLLGEEFPLQDGEEESETVREELEEYLSELFMHLDPSWLVQCSNSGSMVSGEWGLLQFELGDRGYIYFQPDSDLVVEGERRQLLGAWEPFMNEDAFKACFVHTYVKVWEECGLPPYFAGEASGTPFMGAALVAVLHAEPERWSDIFEQLPKGESADFPVPEDIQPDPSVAPATIANVVAKLQQGPDELLQRACDGKLTPEEERVLVTLYCLAVLSG
jgi:hypothetical protein